MVMNLTYVTFGIVFLAYSADGFVEWQSTNCSGECLIGLL